MAQQVESLFKFRNFYYQMEFSPEQHLEITKAIIELIDHPSGSSGLVKSRSMRNNKFEESAVVFSDNEHHELSSHHKRPLYLTGEGAKFEPSLHPGSHLTSFSYYSWT